jgi:hemolysin activation/secretion protein/AraC-like DNA-binding protein
MEGCIEYCRIELPASAERVCRATHWLFLGVLEGAAYAISPAAHRALNGGDLMVVSPGTCATLRSSQLGCCSVVSCEINPDLLLGLLTVQEREWLQKAGAPNDLFFFSEPSSIARQFISAATRTTHDHLRDRAAWVSLASEFWAETMPQDVAVGDPEDAADRFQRLIARKSSADIIRASASDLARECGCSVRHFSRLFNDHFGKSLRDFQIEERLRYASQLLRDSHTKVIDVALESGFGHLSHFNAQFKSQFGVTPSVWRRRRPVAARARRRRMAGAAAALTGLIALLGSERLRAAATTNAPAVSQNQKPTSGTNAPAKPSPHFPINAYDVKGNTVLPADVISKVLAEDIGPDSTYDTLRRAVRELQLTYRGRGYVTVSVTLPPQPLNLTNNVVKIQVVEGKLADIRVSGNRWFSSNNVMASLPSLRTNLILNSAWFQAELDQANQSKDRQISPVIEPGPEPGTSALLLKVKDRIPLHGRWELDNKGTPGTPDLRMDASLQYANLWQLEHQIGVQYNFTPGEMKTDPRAVYDEPLIAAYSTFYRLPLTPRRALLDDQAFTSSDFGYDTVTRKFKAPPLSGRPEMIFFASRSDIDSGILESIPKSVVDTDRVKINQQSGAQNLSVNEGLGARLQGPLPKIGSWQQSLAFGPDWKRYFQASYNTNAYTGFVNTAPAGSTPQLFAITPVTQPLPKTRSDNDYLLFSAAWGLSGADKWGNTSFSLTPTVALSDLRDYHSTQNPITGVNHIVSAPLGHFVTLNGAMTRDQTLVDEWILSLRANGQWANKSLLSIEQFGLGGTMGVRGYRDGEEYGDMGWRVLVEPKTPSIELGNWQGETIIRGRFSVFTDYGERYLKVPQGRPPSLAMWGAGFGTIINVSETFEARAAVAWPLLNTPGIHAWEGRIHFSIIAQF